MVLEAAIGMTLGIVFGHMVLDMTVAAALGLVFGGAVARRRWPDQASDDGTIAKRE